MKIVNVVRLQTTIILINKEKVTILTFMDSTLIIL